MKRFFNIVMTFFLVVLSLARSPLSVQGLGDIDHAQPSLLSSATIAGKVLDENGKPLVDIMVTGTATGGYFQY
jgi:hypothetical protein